ncbi:MAG: hypothetical protein RCG15_02315 [Candidatus Rickettsia vulgarisii]
MVYGNNGVKKVGLNNTTEEGNVFYIDWNEATIEDRRNIVTNLDSLKQKLNLSKNDIVPYKLRNPTNYKNFKYPY